MFGFGFLGKAHIPHLKHTADMPAVTMPPPKEVLLLMSQHIGAPAAPIVKVGDEVKKGQLIAEASAFVSSPVYSSVSGRITKIEEYLRSDGKKVPAIRIESDGLDTLADEIAPPDVHDLDSFIDAVKASGLVGLGGAGFPTSVKLDAVRGGRIKQVVINAAECEPYITSDMRTMLDETDSLVDGVELIKKYMPTVDNIIFGIEKNKPDCIKKLKNIFATDEKVKIFPLPSTYPQGAEKVIIKNTTGKTVPEGKLPADVGVLVMNVTSLSILAKYMSTGMPLIERCITFDGGAVREPKNIIVPIGTAIKDIAEFAGGFKEQPGKVLYGGPMMGIPASSLDDPTTKTTGAITVLSIRESMEIEPTACIHCGRCVDNCPHSLNPTALAHSVEIENDEEKIERLEKYKVNLCIECGTCSYICPAKRPLVQTIRLGKAAVRDYNAHKTNLK